MPIDTIETEAFERLGARPSLRDEVVRTLQAAVISGALRPGVTYSAPQIAQQLGVSATPVREAMLDLAKEGLIVTHRNRGFRVVELSERELDELTELRLMLEVPAVRTITARGIDSDVLAQLRDVAVDAEQAAQRGDYLTHNRLDLEFHVLLLAQAGNANLVTLVTSLRTRSRLYGAAELAARDELEPMLREHHALLDCIERGDLDGATEVMTDHIRHVRREWASRPEATSLAADQAMIAGRS
jgi:DNA-binding GntR family transcriptional regulator